MAAGAQISHAQALSSSQSRSANPHFRALLIGISIYDHYNNSGIFPNIGGAGDLDAIQSALVSEFGLETDADHLIRLDTPEKTTQAAIRAAFKQLVAGTKPGDTVFIHYSGHGSQVPDSSKPGDLEDTIVPSDYNDDQTNEIRGDEIAEYLKEVSRDRPAQVVLSFDSCDSGLITRGPLAPVAGVRKRGLSYEEYRRAYYNVHSEWPPEVQATNPFAANAPLGSAPAEIAASGDVVLEACASGESALEDHGGGRFSQCLAQVLLAAGANTQETYRDVYQQIAAYFRQHYPDNPLSPETDQHPELDGSDSNIDMPLFGGMALPQPPSIDISSDGTNAILYAGQLMGVTQGSAYAIYRAGAKAQPGAKGMPGKFAAQDKIAEAVVKSVDVTRSLLEITSGDHNLAHFAGAHGVETVHNYANSKLVIDETNIRRMAPAEADAILAGLNQIKLIETNVPEGGHASVLLARETPRGATRGVTELFLERNDPARSPIAQLQDGPTLPDQLVAQLKKEAQYQYVMGLKQTDANSLVKIEMRLVDAVPLDSSGKSYKAGGVLDPRTQCVVCKPFLIQVKNDGDTDAHVEILDLRSDATVQPVWPLDDSLAIREDDKIPAHSVWMTLWTGDDLNNPFPFTFTSPDPADTAMAIATTEFVDYSALGDTSRGGARGPASPFDDLLAPASGNLTRGFGGNPPPAPSTWSSFTITMNVRPAPPGS